MRRIVPLLLALAVAAVAHPQEPAPDQPTTTLTARTSLVLVPTLVRTKAGALVFTLTAKDFLLTDDGIPQTVTLDEDTGAQPLALVVAVQTGGSAAPQLDKIRTLTTMINAMAGNVPHTMALVEFDSTPNLAQDFSPDPTRLAKTFRELEPGDKGAAILDTLGFAVDLLRKQPPQYRRAILLISETLDNGSRLPLADALRAISDTNTAIDSFGFATTRAVMKREGAVAFPYAGLGITTPPGPAGGCMAKDHADDPTTSDNRAMQAFDCLSLLAPPLRLAKMAAISAINGFRHNIPETVAELTGGEYFKATDTRSLERGLQTLSNHIPNRYVLTFHPQNPHPGTHALTLRLNNYDNLSVTARTSYWAEPTSP